ncbi:type II secretion system protein GspM [Piscinibacter gummiphilus]|uniref:Type II secretion system protein GspM n=1 Tax=Piscinibacter gummiphilus TaxID=946333 RepID=A0ABZ0D1T6_9BURK|nr:type II secretion system protein GspM [Piscinibacter gummiphilus]WOB09270.1 type II secretion system protein GspM [Piscinibacter gummiphilus]
MTRPTAKLPAPIQALRTEALQRWAAMPPRERMGLTLAGIAIGIAIVWMIGVAPALRTLREAPAQIDSLDLQLQAMQRMATEARDLRGAAPVPATQAAQALKSATERLGDKGKLAVMGDRATLTLSGVTGEALRAWLTEARSGARARPVEAQLTRGPQGYAGTLVVSLGGGN